MTYLKCENCPNQIINIENLHGFGATTIGSKYCIYRIWFAGNPGGEITWDFETKEERDHVYATIQDTIKHSLITIHPQ